MAGTGGEPPRTSDAPYARADDVTYEVVDGQALLVDGQELLRLNAVGALLWELADGSRTLAALVDELAARFPDQPRDRLAADAETFLAELLAGGQLVQGVRGIGEPGGDVALGESE